MSLTPVTQNFASVTRRVFRDRVVFSGGASSRFALSKCFRVRDAKTRKLSRLPSSAPYNILLLCYIFFSVPSFLETILGGSYQKIPVKPLFSKVRCQVHTKGRNGCHFLACLLLQYLGHFLNPNHHGQGPKKALTFSGA